MPSSPCDLWTQRREAPLNWLALGLLLGAWNAVDDPASQDPASHTAPRPASLRGYACVSARAMFRLSEFHPPQWSGSPGINCISR
jgi:hypothetical protein